MKKLLLLLLVAVVLSLFLAQPLSACQICSFYTVDGQRRATCATTATGSKTCIPAGSDCIQTADCCGCGGGGRPGGGGGSTCLSSLVLIDCMTSNEPRRHHLPEFGIIIWQPQTLDSDGN